MPANGLLSITWLPMKYIISIIIAISLGSCATYYSIPGSTHQLIPVHPSVRDTTIHYMIAPYKKGLDSLMNEVVGYTEVDLFRELPEGSLGDFVCDELLEFARKDTLRKIDFCFMNQGGFRIPYIVKGTISRGQLYELLPFENALEIIEMDGHSCKQLLDKAAQQGGAPVSGVRFKITREGATEIIINEKAFDPAARYYILTNDYLANGGEEIMKQALSRQPLNWKMREVVIERSLFKYLNGDTIKTVKDGRVVNVY